MEQTLERLIDFNIYENVKGDNRLSMNTIFMQIALLFATRSECKGRSVGCVITKDNRIISCGYNADVVGGKGCFEDGCILDSNGSCLRSIHAEQNAIAFCARNGIVTDGAVLYTTVSPCISCAKLIVQSGIKTVYYLDEYRIKEGIDYLTYGDIKVVHMSWEI